MDYLEPPVENNQHVAEACHDFDMPFEKNRLSVYFMRVRSSDKILLKNCALQYEDWWSHI